MLSDTEFWRYSVELYGKSGITDVCLTLQDKLGVNVNLLLLLCYCEGQRLQLSREDIETLAAAVIPWHSEYTKPLRGLRRRLALDDRANIEAKQAIFDAEMALEKIEQKLLVGAFNTLKPVHTGRKKTAQNLQRYLGLLNQKAPLQYAGAIEHLRAVI